MISSILIALKGGTKKFVPAAASGELSLDFNGTLNTAHINDTITVSNELQVSFDEWYSVYTDQKMKSMIYGGTLSESAISTENYSFASGLLGTVYEDAILYFCGCAPDDKGNITLIGGEFLDVRTEKLEPVVGGTVFTGGTITIKNPTALTVFGNTVTDIKPCSIPCDLVVLRGNSFSGRNICTTNSADACYNFMTQSGVQLTGSVGGSSTSNVSIVNSKETKSTGILELGGGTHAVCVSLCSEFPNVGKYLYDIDKLIWRLYDCINDQCKRLYEFAPKLTPVYRGRYWGTIAQLQCLSALLNHHIWKKCFELSATVIGDKLVFTIGYVCDSCSVYSVKITATASFNNKDDRSVGTNYYTVYDLGKATNIPTDVPISRKFTRNYLTVSGLGYEGPRVSDFESAVVSINIAGTQVTGESDGSILTIPEGYIDGIGKVIDIKVLGQYSINSTDTVKYSDAQCYAMPSGSYGSNLMIGSRGYQCSGYYITNPNIGTTKFQFPIADLKGQGTYFQWTKAAETTGTGTPSATVAKVVSAPTTGPMPIEKCTLYSGSTRITGSMTGTVEATNEELDTEVRSVIPSRNLSVKGLSSATLSLTGNGLGWSNNRTEAARGFLHSAFGGTPGFSGNTVTSLHGLNAGHYFYQNCALGIAADLDPEFTGQLAITNSGGSELALTVTWEIVEEQGDTPKIYTKQIIARLPVIYKLDAVQEQ